MAAAAAMLAENYQLKWHSHGVNLHSSIATLHRSESFSDVTLATADGRYVAAHRFVLSACSAYLHQLFQATTGARGGGAGGPSLVVVLPPDISHRTLAVLLQYMYSGEATVSNEQLDGVLRAGEILRVKGLCRSRHAKDARSERRGGVLTRQDPNRGPPQLKRPASADGTNCKLSTSPAAAVATADDVSRQGPPPKKSALESQPDQKENEGGGGESGEGIGIEQSMQIELLVKEEPIEWDNLDAAPSHNEMNIKSEIYSGEEELEEDEELELEEGEEEGEEEEEDLSEFYAPLTCDMCQETFTTPKLWVRHTETHPPTELPRRKTKRNANGDVGGGTSGAGDDEDGGGGGTTAEYPPLRCELCQEVYSNPGDWVRHIQSAHTEEQLAMSNNSSPRAASSASSAGNANAHAPRRHRTGSAASGQGSGQGAGALNGRKHCPLCEKTFPSHASMLVHSRTHTGERPYECSVCAKEFNVKSNLLRHMRTLHDEIVNPGNVRTGADAHELDSI